jgi:leucyl/phenylalanyl-tRNA--protein transferase
MPVYLLDETLVFPPPQFAEEDGLLAVGGDLSPERLIQAYRLGIFPWYNEPPILWWSPDPRFVLFPSKLKISKSMKQVVKRGEFEFRFNTAFAEVIHHCRIAGRKDQDGTWITDEVEEAYNTLHRMGIAVSAEAWKYGELAGGLYGIRMGKVFFGESMFTKKTNASKFAFIHYVRQLQSEGVELIDCQIHTAHLESLGAEMIPGQTFRSLLNKLI